MPSKTLIALTAVLFGAVAAAPASAQSAPECPPGVTDASYCAVHNESGLETKEKSANSNDHTVKVTIHCEMHPECVGTLYLEGTSGTSSRAHTSQAVIDGSAHYDLKFGETATIAVPLTAAGERALERTGTLTATVVAVANNVRSVIAHVKVKGHKAAKKKHSKHTTHATTKPGFTG